MSVHLKGKKNTNRRLKQKQKQKRCSYCSYSVAWTNQSGTTCKRKKKVQTEYWKKKKIVVAIVPFEQTKVALLAHWRFLYIN